MNHHTATVKLFITMGMVVGGIAAWTLDHFESKEHSAAVKEGVFQRLESMDKKLDIIIQRGD